MNTSIVVCGKKFDIGTRVVLWDEPSGFNAYDTTKYVRKEENRATGKVETKIIRGKRYKPRNFLIPNPTISQLQGIVTQFFLHHSGLYRARTTFDVLHKERKLSCHFILDDDGTLYQTLDLKEKAQHGGKCNPMSVGIEIDSRANADRFPNAYDERSQNKYKVGSRNKRVDFINGQKITGYEYNDAQYKTLIHLGIAMCEIFPIIGTNADFPRETGLTTKIIKKTISKPTSHLGFICHFHASRSKIDPVSFDFSRFLAGVKHKNPNQSSSLEASEETLPKTELETDDFFEELGIEVEPDVIVLENWFDIQTALVELGYNPGTIDGVWGKKTRKALRSFQASTPGLIEDGVWGPKTRAEMEKQLGRKNG